MVCIEALGCGCPVVASDIPAIADIVECSDNIHLVPVQNSGAIFEAINTVFTDLDAELNVVKRSHSSLLARFGWKSVTDNYIGLLERPSSLPEEK